MGGLAQSVGLSILNAAALKNWLKEVDARMGASFDYSTFKESVCSDVNEWLTESVKNGRLDHDGSRRAVQESLIACGLNKDIALFR
jgi:hypothetical protein